MLYSSRDPINESIFISLQTFLELGIFTVVQNVPAVQQAPASAAANVEQLL